MTTLLLPPRAQVCMRWAHEQGVFKLVCALKAKTARGQGVLPTVAGCSTICEAVMAAPRQTPLPSKPWVNSWAVDNTA